MFYKNKKYMGGKVRSFFFLLSYVLKIVYDGLRITEAWQHNRVGSFGNEPDGSV